MFWLILICPFTVETGILFRKIINSWLQRYNVSLGQSRPTKKRNFLNCWGKNHYMLRETGERQEREKWPNPEWGPCRSFGQQIFPECLFHSCFFNSYVQLTSLTNLQILTHAFLLITLCDTINTFVLEKRTLRHTEVSNLPKSAQLVTSRT